MRRLLHSLLPLTLLLCATTVRGQENLGMATGNYAGIAGAWLNPASIVDSRYKFDMMAFGFNSYFTNNYLEVRNATLVRRLLHGEPYNGSFEAVKEDLLRPAPNMEGPVNAFATSQWQMPFSFMAGLGSRSSIALNIRNRSSMFLDSLDRSTASMLFAELGDPDLMGSPQRSTGMRYGFLNWMESGFTYGRVLVSGKHHFLKGAATAKLLAGNAGIHIASERIEVTFQDANTLSLQSPLIEYARTTDADFDTYNRRNLFNNVEDYGLGWDAGLVYEFRSNVQKRRFVDLDQTEKERRDLNKYLLRVGVSLLDVGKFTFDRRPLTQNHSADIRDWDISELNASNLDDFDEVYSNLIDVVPNGSSTFTYRLPTAVALNVDLHLLGGFYINAAAYRDATSYFSTTDATLKAREWTAVTPRFENRWFGLYLPVSVSDGNTRIGATVRMGPLYLGSTNLADLLANEQNTSADFHAGLRFSIGHGKPSALKKKYEGFRKQQEAIGSNRMRIDSLEREVYALKMVLATDTARGRITVLNNFYGPGPDTASQMLVLENYLLLQQLADARLAKGTAEPENAGSGDPATQRNAAQNLRASQQQAAAQEAQAKEMERIRRQMRTQTAVMATSAGATVALATQDNAPAETQRAANGTAIYLNDSTILLHGDTLPMITPRSTGSTGANDARREPPTMDALPVVETVRDTILIPQRVPKDPMSDLQPLLKTIYFDVNSSELGAEAGKQLRSLAAWMLEHPDSHLEVTGVADASGTAAANDALANQRAQSTLTFLSEQGVPSGRIEKNWRISPTNGEANANDRRVELRMR